jgi:murein DD-endopeptidase MepM/ murein hydrolase activator NlpD
VTDQRDVPSPRRRRAVAAATAGFSAIVTIALLGALGHFRAGLLEEPGAAPAPPVADAAPAAAPAASAVATAPKPLRMSVLTMRLARNQTLSQALAALKLAPGQVQGILEALRDKFPFHRARPGDQLRIEQADGQLARFTYRQSAADEWTVAPAAEGGALRGAKREVALTTELARVEVEIRGSVWESLQKAGEDPALAVIASDVLAWDVDFYRDVQAGDRMKVLVEKTYVDGKLLRYGEVLAAEYDGGVTGRKRLFRYTDPSGQTSYFDDAGNSARRGFLKSPLKYAHITSKFGGRIHPVLGYQKAHQGVDYGAPTGTPVWAVGDATVVSAGWSGGCGKAVTLRHRNGFDTVYCHLSAIAVHAGSHVAQKQLIGAVGQTGLATGPHLHYAVKRGGAYVNPLSLKVPREAPIAPEHKADFDAKVTPLRAKLDSAPVA